MLRTFQMPLVCVFRVTAMVGKDIEFDKLDINPCPLSEGNPQPNLFAGIARCRSTTVVSRTTILVCSQAPVNSENFARVLFSRNFAHAKLRESKFLAKSLCLLLMWVNHALVANFNWQICLFTLFAK